MFHIIHQASLSLGLYSFTHVLEKNYNKKSITKLFELLNTRNAKIFILEKQIGEQIEYTLT